MSNSESNKITNLIKNKEPFSYSFEVTPAISKEEIDNLEGDPVFFSVTWHANSHQCKDLDIAPLQTANLLVRKNKIVLMHLSCDMLTKEYLLKLLAKLQEWNICNLFLVLGEGKPNTPDFKNTSELIKFIRKETGQYFCIGVAGFPECSEEKLLILKEKIESGADFIITQAFFDSEVFATFINRCEKIGIKKSVIPGVFLYKSYTEFCNFLNLCKIKVSNNLREKVQAMDTSGENCSDILKQIIQEVNTKCNTTHFHFFTLNKLQNTYKLIQKSIK